MCIVMLCVVVVVVVMSHEQLQDPYAPNTEDEVLAEE